MSTQVNINKTISILEYAGCHKAEQKVWHELLTKLASQDPATHITAEKATQLAYPLVLHPKKIG